jgi:gluconokinase
VTDAGTDAGNDTEPQGTTTVVVMGVAGCGKSTVAAHLQRRTGWVLAEGDDFHPPANVAKMRAGTPLTDADREPWLQAVAAWIGQREGDGANALVTCSALKRSYRDLLRAGHSSVWCAHLTAPPEVLRQRLEGRKGHFMPDSLLQSQLDDLEPLAADEAGITVSVAAQVEHVVAEIFDALTAAGRT